ncbi:MAG: hypothetical protein IIC92_07445 [Chloroflexi bacterium]|nr:hypothetical protein [Chloroflexota bacterium]
MELTAEQARGVAVERRKTLAVVSLATLFGHPVWFSTNAVGPPTPESEAAGRSKAGACPP